MLSVGQILWKTGIKHETMGSVSEIVHLLLNKYMFAGILIYITSTFYWFYIIKKFDITKVYPLQSMSYLLVLVLGYVILKEPVTKNTIIGTLIIVLGVFIVTKQ
jgi:drug/metabolite transporter (DMT)-like permease